jgi:hypothetical protein
MSSYEVAQAVGELMAARDQLKLLLTLYEGTFDVRDVDIRMLDDARSHEANAWADMEEILKRQAGDT